MALDANILLQRTTPNLMQALQSGINAGQSLRQAPLIEALKKQQIAQAQAQAQQESVMAPLRQQLLEAQVAKAQQEPGGPAPVKLGEGDVLVNPVTGAEVATGRAKPDGALSDIRSEVRKSIGGEVKSISDQASVVVTNFNKLQNLTGEISKGNRSSVAQGLVALVKIGDPSSVVKDSEMVAALNQQNPIAAITGMLSGKDIADNVVQSVVARIDPLNPENINVDELLATANAMVSANVPSLQERFASQRERAAGNLTEAGINSIFNKRLIENIGGLSKIGEPKKASVKDLSDEDLFKF